MACPWRDSLPDEIYAIAQHIERSVPVRRAMMDAHDAMLGVDSLIRQRDAMRGALVLVLDGWRAGRYTLDFAATDSIRTALEQ